MSVAKRLNYYRADFNFSQSWKQKLSRRYLDFRRDKSKSLLVPKLQGTLIVTPEPANRTQSGEQELGFITSTLIPSSSGW